jgi:hypothetical protein
MIINGGSRRNGRFFSRHLMNGEHNEYVTLCEIRSLAAQNVRDAFREMEAVAMGTLCRNYFYHANINPRDREELTPAQWKMAIDTLERHLGLEGKARFVVEHRKAGRTHRHVIWSRIDVHSMRAAVMADDYAKHQAAARELEEIFGHPGVESVLGRTRASGPRPSRRPESWESFRGQVSGIDPYEIKLALTRIYHASANGMEFATRLFEQGYKLVRGRKAGMCILDTAGHLHSLARRLDGVTASELRALMRDAFAALPATAQAIPLVTDG